MSQTKKKQNRIEQDTQEIMQRELDICRTQIKALEDKMNIIMKALKEAEQPQDPRFDQEEEEYGHS